MLAAAIFSDDSYAQETLGRDGGLIAGHGEPLGAWAIGTLAQLLWVFALSFLMFFTLKFLQVFRVSAEVEAAGGDVSKAGGQDGGDGLRGYRNSGIGIPKPEFKAPSGSSTSS